MTAASVPDYASNQTEIIARPSWWPYRLKWVLMGLLLVGYGLWSVYDGFYKWPAENQRARERGLTELPHPGFDVPFNQIIAVVAPTLGLAAAGWALYNSRGQYRLAGDTLYVPGHPPVPLDAVQT